MARFKEKVVLSVNLFIHVMLSVLSPKPIVLSTKPSVLFIKPNVHSVKPSALSTKPSVLYPKPSFLSTNPPPHLTVCKAQDDMAMR